MPLPFPAAFAFPFSFFSRASADTKPPPPPITPSPAAAAAPDESPSDEEAAAAEVEAFLARLAAYTPNSLPPSSARISDTLVPLPSRPLTLHALLSLSQLWGYTSFLSLKTLHVLSSLLAHTLLGPPRRSWGVQMTLLNSIMRDVGAHHHLAPSVLLIRLLSALPAPLIHPPASEALITPVTFRVRRRGLTGMLEGPDRAEDGRREIAGEWVVSKGLWRRLNAEWRREQHEPRPANAGPARVKGRVILYLHGGAYYVFSASTHRPITVPLSRMAHARVFSFNYRLAPETRFPGPLHDAVSAYLRLLYDLHIPPSSLFIAGDSAGGGLALALALYLRDAGLPLPAGLILFSPWVDLTMSSDSWSSNFASDIVPLPPADSHLNPVTNYLGPDGLRPYLTHPYASPLFGDFHGLPPMLVQTGEAEVLRDEGELLARKARSQGVRVRHECFEDGVHVFQMFPFLDQTRRAFESVREFVREVCPSSSGLPPPTPTPPPVAEPSAPAAADPDRPTRSKPPSTPTDVDPTTTDSDPDLSSPDLDAETVALPANSRTRVVSSVGGELAVGAEAVQRELDKAGLEEGGESDSDKDSPAVLAASTFVSSPPATATITAPPSPAKPRSHARHATISTLLSLHSLHDPASPASPTSTKSPPTSPRGRASPLPPLSKPTARARALSHPELVELVRGLEAEEGRRGAGR